MHLALKRASLLSFLFVGGLGVGQIIPPFWKFALIRVAESAYQEATYNCDRAMRTHLLAKMRIVHTANTESVEELQAAEVDLLACQDYDMLRKNLILWGLNENDLSLLALRAIEAKSSNLQKVIETHEIRF